MHMIKRHKQFLLLAFVIRMAGDLYATDVGASWKRWVIAADPEEEAALLCYGEIRQLTANNKDSWASATYYAANLFGQLGRKEEAASLWKEMVTAIPCDKVTIYWRWEPSQSGGTVVNVGEEGRHFLETFRKGQ